jgi:hypothetical protein
MRRIFILLIALASLVVPAAAVGGAHGSGQGTACVFTTQLSAASETAGSTSTASGHTQIKIRYDGTLEFKTHILNPDAETFVAGHVHNAPAGVAGPIVVPLLHRAGHIRRAYRADWHDRDCGFACRRDLRAPGELLRELRHDGVPGRRDPRSIGVNVGCRRMPLLPERRRAARDDAASQFAGTATRCRAWRAHHPASGPPPRQ